MQVVCLFSSAGHVRSLSSSAFLLHEKYTLSALFKEKEKPEHGDSSGEIFPICVGKNVSGK